MIQKSLPVSAADISKCDDVKTRPRFFGMVSTRSSLRYTELAVHSFFKWTPLRENDRFVLIDNDFSIEEPFEEFRIDLVRNGMPRSFAENVNQVLALADASGADLYFLNNDIVFTPGWLDPLETVTHAIISPFSNGEVAYRNGAFAWNPFMDLEQYIGHEQDLQQIANTHRERNSGYLSTLTIPFFCVKIPREVYSSVGLLDTRFGKGGAEDRDYALRTLIAGFAVCYACPSYVLHFQGKSTWRGAETPQETKLRDMQYLREFEAKWGQLLTRMFIYNDLTVVSGLELQSNDYGEIVRKIIGRPDG